MAHDTRAPSSTAFPAPSLSSRIQHRGGLARTALFLATRDVLKDRKVAVLVVCVLGFSFVNLVFFTGFQYGLQNSFEEQLISTFTSHLTLEPRDGRKYIEDASTVRDKADLIPGVVAVAPVLEDGGVQVLYRGRAVGSHLLAVKPSEYAAVSSVPAKMAEGTFLGDEDTDQAVLGVMVSGYPEGSGKRENGFDFGFGLGAWVGDKVRVLFSNGVAREYRVKGVVDTGGFMSDFDVYLTRKEFGSVFPDTRNKASQILVRISDRGQASDYRNLFLSEGIREEIKTWEDQAGFIQNISNSVSVVAGVTGFVGVITVAITMAIVIYINTTNKRRLMGVLKAIGATDGTVFRVFIYEAVLFGVLGILVGVGLSQVVGAIFTKNPIPIPAGGGVVPDIRPDLLAVGGLSVLASGLVAAYYPSWRAARQPIVKSIWG